MVARFACVSFLTAVFFTFTSAVGNAQPAGGSAFLDQVSKRISVPNRAEFFKFCPVDQSRFARRVLAEYGAMFVAANDIDLPQTCYFSGEIAATKFQSGLHTTASDVDGVQITLQTPAMSSLLRILEAAKQLNVSVSPLDGQIAGARTYSDTVNIWNSRFEPALRFWVNQNKITADESSQVTNLPFEAQVEKVIDWESNGYLFGTGRRSSIFSSTAPPGASQHLSLIAFDVAGKVTPLMTALFNANGWYQTIKGDSDHFTYLGVTELELPKRGLKQIEYQGYRYWIPDLPPATESNQPD